MLNLIEIDEEKFLALANCGLQVVWDLQIDDMPFWSKETLIDRIFVGGSNKSLLEVDRYKNNKRFYGRDTDYKFYAVVDEESNVSCDSECNERESSL